MKSAMIRLSIGWVCVGWAMAADDAPRGKALVEVKEGMERLKLNCGYPDEIPWLFPEKMPKRLYLPADALAAGQGACTNRVRAILTAPEDGYRSIAVAAGGWYQVLLSDDASPESLHPLWTDGALGYNIQPGFNEPLLRGDGPWRYFRKDQPRLVEIRYIHTSGPHFVKLEWSGRDGKRGPVPAECLASPKVPESDSPEGDGTTPDGVWKEVLSGVHGESIPLDLRKAKPLTSGWAEFDGEAEDVLKSAKGEQREYLIHGGLATALGGDIEIPFETKREGFGVLATRFQLCNGFFNFSHMEVERVIDGVSLGREILRTPDSETRLFRCVTPWLAKGKHTVILRVWPCEQIGAARLCGAHVEILGADDSKKIREKLASMDTFMPERGNGGFLRSPACVELISRTSERPAVAANGKTFPTRPATMHTWWADVPLPESGEAVALKATFSSDQTIAEAKATWLETRVGEHRELWVRTGDSLRLTACPNAGDKGRAVVKVEGKERETPDGKPWIFKFEKAGDIVVEANYEPGEGAAVTHRMIVKVVPRTTDDLKSPLMRRDGGIYVGQIFGTAWPDGGDFCAIRPKAPDKQFPQGTWEMRAYIGGRDIPCALRAGPHGPVCGGFSAAAADIRWRFARRYSRDTARGRDEHHFIATHFPKGFRVRLSLIPGPGQVWSFARPDPENPLEQVVEPWHYGNSTMAEFWLVQKPNTPPSGIPSRFSILPPLKKPDEATKKR